MSRTALALLSQADLAVDVLLVDEDFATTLPNGFMTTPGTDDPDNAWSRATAATPTSSAGPNGGANPITRAVEPGNGYAYTEASGDPGPFTMETPEIDASLGPAFITFDVHMRFGSAGGIADGNLRVQGWDGSAWSSISTTITGSQQTSPDDPYVPSSNFGTYGSTAFSNSDFKFRFRFTKGASPFDSNYDCAVDNIQIRGPAQVITQPGGGGGGSGNLTASPGITPDLGLGAGAMYVSKSGNDGNDGLSPGQAKLTIQAGIDAASAGFDVIVGPGIYYETPTIASKGTSQANPLRLVAETRGTVTISDLWQDAFEGNVSWTNEGGGTYSASHGDVFIGSYTDPGSGTTHMLFHYDDQADLEASTVTTTGGPVDTPEYGFAPVGGTVFIRLPGLVNPNGASIELCDSFSTTLISITNSPYVIIDGINITGGGDGDAITCDAASDHVELYNVISTHCRRVLDAPDDTLVHWTEYYYPGMFNFVDELIQLNGVGGPAIFDLVKNYFSSGGNSFLEGGLCEQAGSSPRSDCDFSFNYIHEVFDGMRMGAFTDSAAHHNVFDFCYDDAIEFEHFRTSSPCSNLEAYENLVLNCYGSFFSHQDSTSPQSMDGPHFVYRNVFWIDNSTHSHPPFLIKNRRLQASTLIHYYHNVVLNILAQNDGFGLTNQFWWRDDGNEQRPENISIRNNIVLMPGGMSQGGAPDADANVLVNDVSYAPAEGTGGAFAGTDVSDAQMVDPDNFDFTLQAGSDAVGIGIALDPSWPENDSFAGQNDDAGVFPFGETMPPDWPRPRSRVWNTDTPTRWPFA